MVWTPGSHYLPHLIFPPWISPTLFPFLITPLQFVPFTSSLFSNLPSAASQTAAWQRSPALGERLVNNRPWDSSLLSSTSSVCGPFLHVDTDRQERLWGGGSVPFLTVDWRYMCKGIITPSPQVVIATCKFAKTNSSSEQRWGYSQNPLVRVEINFCGLLDIFGWTGFSSGEKNKFEFHMNNNDLLIPSFFLPFVQQTGKVGTFTVKIIHNLISSPPQVPLHPSVLWDSLDSSALCVTGSASSHLL